MKLTTIDNQKYLTPSWEDMGNICFSLAQKILAQEKSFDRLVALVKGGLTWSRTLLDYLNIENLSAFQIKFYNDVYKTQRRPIIVQSLPVVVENEKILLFDDVVDSGETLKIGKDYLLMCGARKVITTSLYYKHWAKIKPDYCAAETSAWIIFPHEIRETIELLFKSWRKNKVSMAEIKRRLIKLGLAKEQIKYYLK